MIDPTSPWTLPDGAIVRPDGVDFRLWAPKLNAVELELLDSGRFPMEKGGNGRFQVFVPNAKAGQRYRYILPHGHGRPDPVSRFQPEGVHGPSQIIDPQAYRWQDAHWKGMPLADVIVYEFHPGTFTEAGTFQAAIERLDELVALGVTAMEIMPVAECPGRWNWGYDGVGLYAPYHVYGHPDDLRAFVDACHARGLAVILDVVYNHLGPEGNYLGEFGPYFTRRYHTPWGSAWNFEGADSRPVRDYIIQNALYWITEFHIDGLRLDAIRFMFDASETPIVSELNDEVRRLETTLGRRVFLIGESNVHDPKLIASREDLGSGFDAIWNDEIPHAIYGVVTQHKRVSSRLYNGGPDLAIALRSGYLYQNEGGPESSRHDDPVPGRHAAMIQGLQTHDRIGNLPDGARLHILASMEVARAAVSLIFLHPAVPFIFMGEEFASPAPFCFFSDYGDEHLRRAVVEGRKRDYPHYDWKKAVSPISPEAFLNSKIGPREKGDARMLAWYEALISLRKRWRAEGILDQAYLHVRYDPAHQLFELRYTPENSRAAWLAVRLDLGTASAQVTLHSTGEIVLHSGSAGAKPAGAFSLGMNEAAAGYGAVS